MALSAAGTSSHTCPSFATANTAHSRFVAFARLASLRGLDDRDAAALRVVREAMIANPLYVAGTGDFDSALIDRGRGSIVAKSGAEGVLGLAHLPSGTGLVLKVVDGAARAVPAAALALIRRLNLLDAVSLGELDSFARAPMLNRAGLNVGTIRAL